MSAVTASAPARVLPTWSRCDLIRRVGDVLEAAHRMVGSIDESLRLAAPAVAHAAGVAALLREKVVAETAMLLLCVDPLREADERTGRLCDSLARLLIPHARHRDVLAAICLDPGMARDQSIAHAILSRLGHTDAGVDALLAESLAMGPDFGPERLPHRRLEQTWLTRVWSGTGTPDGDDSRLVADSMLGRPMDALGSTRLDLYAFTHAVMYASDLGRRPLQGARPTAAIGRDADDALGFALDSNDFDLTAEVLMTWPMLGLSWSPAATFAFGVLAGVEDGLGFLPGVAFDAARYQALSGQERSRFALTTSYHSTYVMGMLCAAALTCDCPPPATVSRESRSCGAAAALLSLVAAEDPEPCWREPLRALASDQQDSLAALLLTMILRRARTQGNVRLVRDALEVALAADLIDGPAPMQAVALLRRIPALESAPWRAG